MRKNPSIFCVMAAASLCAFAPVASAAPATPLEVWVRTPGTYGSAGTEPPKTAARTLDLSTFTPQQGARTDVQYSGQSAYYRGVPLREIIAQYKPPQQADLMLLHFRNGMVIPLPFRHEPTMARLEPLVALGMSSTEKGPYSAEFPPLSKHVEGYADVRQVTFTGNKLVVRERYHPDVPEIAREQFTPWSLADTLVGIEFAEDSAYYRQFVPTAATRPGAELFRQSCQFCHGVRKVGASFGWDYAQPLELHTYRSDASKLFYHIRYRVEYRATFEQMPALKHITETEAAVLWNWMRAVSTAPMTRYTPTH